MIIRLCLGAALLFPAAAMAQGNPGPFGALFGRTPERAGQDRSIVEVRSSLGAQYDTALLPPEDAPVGTPTQSGVASGATAALIYEHASSRLTVNFTGGATRSQYLGTPGYGVNLFNANARVSRAITTRIQGEAAASYVHSPYFAFYPGSGLSQRTVNQPVQLFSPYATQMLDNETAEASAGLTAKLTRRSTLNAVTYRRQTLFSQTDDDFVLTGYQATWNWRFQRNLGLRVGYGREHADQRGAQGRDTDHELIDVGIDFNHEFSLARRTTLGFTTSTSIIKSSNTNRELRVNGAIVFSKAFRRTWAASAEARRGTYFVPGFFEPLFTDTVGLSLSGMFTPRLEWTSGASAGRGVASFTGTSGFNTVTAFSQLSVAVSRHFALYAGYVAYGYELPENATNLQLPDRLARQAFSVGLNAYLPVYSRMRQRQ